MSKPFEKVNLFLTYSQVDEEMEKLNVLRAIEDIAEKYPFEITNFIVAEERHKDQGKHFHVYLKLADKLRTRNTRLLDIKFNEKVFHPNIQAVKAPEFCRKYCVKDGNYITNFSDSEIQKGPKNALKSEIANKIIKDNYTALQVVNEHPEEFFNYSKLTQNISLFRLHSSKPIQTNRCKGIWIHGPAGTGKSYAVREYCHRFSISLYVKPQNKWFDGYTGEKAILLDDLDTSTLSHYIKIWTDKYASSGEIKGGTVPLLHTLFFITSNYSICEMFPNKIINNQVVENNSTLRLAIARRMQVRHFEEIKDNQLDNIELPSIVAEEDLFRVVDEEENENSI